MSKMEEYFKRCQIEEQPASLSDYFVRHMNDGSLKLDEKIFITSAVDLKQKWTQMYSRTSQKYASIKVSGVILFSRPYLAFCAYY